MKRKPLYCIANTGNYKNIDPVHVLSYSTKWKRLAWSHFLFWKILSSDFVGILAVGCWDISRLWSDLAHQKKTKGPPIISIISSNSFLLCLFYLKHPNFPALKIPLTSRLYFNSPGTSIAWNIDRGRWRVSFTARWIEKQKATV